MREIERTRACEVAGTETSQQSQGQERKRKRCQKMRARRAVFFCSWRKEYNKKNQLYPFALFIAQKSTCHLCATACRTKKSAAHATAGVERTPFGKPFISEVSFSFPLAGDTPDFG